MAEPALEMDRSVLRRKAVGRLLVGLGVAAWLPYLWLRYVLRQPVEPSWFVLAHLAGVIPGSLLLRLDWLRARLAARFSGEGREPAPPSERPPGERPSTKE